MTRPWSLALAVPRIVPSASVPRGMVVEYDAPRPFGAVVAVHPDGRLEHETERILMVNVDDYNAARGASKAVIP